MMNVTLVLAVMQVVLCIYLYNIMELSMSPCLCFFIISIVLSLLVTETKKIVLSAITVIRICLKRNSFVPQALLGILPMW